MAVKILWPIDYACGHSDERDLSAKTADRRAGYARWLASKECTDCWRAKQGNSGDRLSTEEWLAKRRAEEDAAVAEWEDRAAMPALDGPDAALAWGQRSRHRVLSAAYESLVMNGAVSDDAWTESVEEPARRITAASWWIDNRDAAPDDVAELVAAGILTAAAPNENPYA